VCLFGLSDSVLGAGHQQYGEGRHLDADGLFLVRVLKRRVDRSIPKDRQRIGDCDVEQCGEYDDQPADRFRDGCRSGLFDYAGSMVE
jgi:hypothetical protein